MILLLLGIHLYFSIKLKFIQKYIIKAFQIMFHPINKPSNTHVISAFSTLSTTLAATLGTGNIVGVSTAIALGGPGAIFWCWITGVLGMATSYAECYLGIKYRKKIDNEYIGGPMYVLENGINNKFLAILFSICTVLASFGVGCTTQSNSISTALYNTFHISPQISGLIFALLVGFVIIGGFNSISKICMKLVPSMAFFYTLGCIIILIINRSYILDAFNLILAHAFSYKSCIAGLTGITISKCIRYGVSRGLYTNEAGLGSTPITASLGTSHSPKDQSLISMTAAFLDTVVMCAITGITIITTLLSNSNNNISLYFNQLHNHNYLSTDFIVVAFETIPIIGNLFLTVSLVAFAFATLIGWFSFGEKAFQYTFNRKHLNLYKITYIVMIYIGAVISLDLVWEMCDLFNALMAIPNIISLIILRNEISKY